MAALFAVCAASHSQEVQGDPGSRCVKPPPGQFAYACEAQDAATLYQSRHLGDQWIECEEMSGTHGTAGFGVAAFFANEGRPYWHDEIRFHINTLKQTLPADQFVRVRREQRLWERALPREIAKAQQQVSEEAGTLAMYLGEGNAMMVVRRRALTLACTVENSHQPKSR